MKLAKSGWRTYAACIVLVLIGVATGLGYPVPDWLVTVVAGLGGIAGRAAITNNAKKTTEDARALVDSLAVDTTNHTAALSDLDCRLSDLKARH